jgi:hypothetical protein
MMIVSKLAPTSQTAHRAQRGLRMAPCRITVPFAQRANKPKLPKAAGGQLLKPLDYGSRQTDRL